MRFVAFARVRLPPSVTVKLLLAPKFGVIVAPSVSVAIVIYALPEADMVVVLVTVDALTVPEPIVALLIVRLPTVVVVEDAAIEVLPSVIGKPEDAAAVDTQAVPFDAKTLPFVPGATKVTEPVPLPIKTLLAVKVAKPVPPCAAVIGVETLVTVALTSVKLLTVLMVFPSCTAVLPIVIGVAKFVSN